MTCTSVGILKKPDTVATNAARNRGHRCRFSAVERETRVYEIPADA